MTIIRHIKFSMAQMVRDQKMSTFIPIARSIQGFYMKGGFIIKFILMENQFEPMRGTLATEKVELNAISKGEHMPDIEWHIRILINRGFCIFNILPL